MKSSKLALIFILVISLISIVPDSTSANTSFKDVSSNDEAYKEINYLASKRIIKGYDNGTFRPSNNLTKAQAAKMLVIARGKENTPQSAMSFTDISSKEQQKFISIAVSLGYFKVENSKKFYPNVEIKRDEMAYALSTAFNISDKPTALKPIKLNDIKGHKYVDRINGLYYAGITQGDNGNFLSNNYLTRKQFSLFVARAMNSSFSLPVKLPDQTAGTSFVKVNTGSDSLNVRSSSSDASAIIGKLSHGTVVEVLGKNGDWLLVKTTFGQGYIHGYFTVPAGTDTPNDNVKPDAPSPTSSLIGKVTVASLNVRSSESDSASLIDTLKRGQEVQVVRINGYWASIKYGSKTGFVHKSFLKLINQSSNPLKDRIVVVDAGHGGSDPGASANGLSEKNVTLDVSKRVEAKLKRAGAKVLMTRSGDSYPSLTARTEYAKKNFAEVFVSIHINAGPSSASGAETFYDSSTNPNALESKLLATYIQNNLVKKADMKDRGVKDARFQVIRNNNVAAVLVELGFVTNSNDAKKLASDKYLEIYAESVYQGLVQYYSAK